MKGSLENRTQGCPCPLPVCLCPAQTFSGHTCRCAHTHMHLHTNTHTQAYTRAHTHIHRHTVQPGLNGSWLEGETGFHSCSCGSFLRPGTSCTNSADTDRLALSCLRPVTAVKGCVRGPLQPSVHRANRAHSEFSLLRPVTVLLLQPHHESKGRGMG